MVSDGHLSNAQRLPIPQNPTGPAAPGSLLGHILFHRLPPPPPSLLWSILLVPLTLIP